MIQVRIELESHLGNEKCVSTKKKTAPPKPIFNAELVDRRAPINILDKASLAR